MAKPKADVDLVTDVRQSLEAMRKYQARMGQMLDDMDHRLRRVDKRGDQVGKQFGKVTKQIALATAGMMGLQSASQGVHTIVGQLVKQLEHVKNIDSMAKDKHTEFAKAREDFRFAALSEGSNLDLATADEMIMKSMVPDKAKLYKMAKQLISSQMSPFAKEILEGALANAAARPELTFDEESLVQIGIGVQNLMNANPGTTREEQMAQFFAGMLQSRVTDIAAYNRYVVTAITRMMQYGWSQQAATTLVNSLTTVLNDEYGQISSTIAQNLPVDLAVITQEMGLDLKGEEQLYRSWKGDDIAREIQKRYSARLMAMQGDVQLTDEERASLEAYGTGEGHGRIVGKAAAMTLLVPSDTKTTAYQRYKEGYDMIPQGQAAIDFINKKLEERKSDPNFAGLRMQMGVENLGNAAYLDPYASIRSNLGQAIENISRAGRSKRLGEDLSKMLSTWNQEFLDTNEVLDQMQRKTQWTLDQLNYDLEYARTIGGGRDQSNRPVTAYDYEARALQLEMFLELLQDIRKGINGVEKNTGKKPAKLNDPAPAFIPLDTQ